MTLIRGGFVKGGNMSHEDEIALQEADDERDELERWFQGTLEYWFKLTDTLTAEVIASEGQLVASCNGVIE